MGKIKVKKKFKSMPIVFVLLISIPLTIIADAQWPMFHYNPQLTGMCPYFGPETPDMLWTLQVVDYQVPQGNSMIGEDGTIYFAAAEYPGTNSGFFAIDPSGFVKWSLPLTGYDLGYGCPAIGSDGTIYVLGDSLWAIEDSVTYGNIKWCIPHIGCSTSVPILIGNDDVIYYKDGGHIRAIYPDGTQKWREYYGCDMSSGLAMSLTGDTLYTPSLDPGNPNALMFAAADAETGNSLWYTYLGQAPDRLSAASPAVGADGTIYFTINNDVEVIAFSPDGDILWSHEIPNGENMMASPVIGPDGTIYQTGCCIEYPVYADSLFAINPDGTGKWTCFLPGEPAFGSPAIDAAGTIYISDSDAGDPEKINAVCAIDTGGTLKWTCPVEDLCFCSPSISANGTIYVITFYGKMYAIGSETGIEEQEEGIPLNALLLHDLHPNPFSSSLSVSFSLPETMHADLSVYDINGRVVERLEESIMNAGEHTSFWSPGSLPSGCYIIRLSTKQGTCSKRCIFAR
jgi:outer membrane protein assembly factor BamB